jgi:UDP:flavonoid glycosyltransferase YjiC (YdhE family)
MRILGCPIGTPGLCYPVIGTSLELARRGHEVRLLTGRQPADLSTAAGLAWLRRHGRARGCFTVGRWALPASVVDQAAQVEQALPRFAADLLVTSELALGPLIAAERAGIPVVVVGLMSYLWPADESSHVAPVTDCGRHQRSMFDQTMDLFNIARVRCGLSPLPVRCDERNPLLGDLFLLRNVAELVPEAAELPDRVRFVGPCRWEPTEDVRADIEWLATRTRPTVYVQLARNFDRSSLWEWLPEATARARVDAVVEIGRSLAQPPPRLPAHVRLVSRRRSSHLLAGARAVISHGTTTPTLGGLCHGLPSLLAPTGAEQPMVARLCRRAEVAIELNPATPSWRLVRRLVEDEHLYRRAAEAQRLLCAPTESPAAAADEIEEFVSGRRLAGVGRAPA